MRRIVASASLRFRGYWGCGGILGATMLLDACPSVVNCMSECGQLVASPLLCVHRITLHDTRAVLAHARAVLAMMFLANGAPLWAAPLLSFVVTASC